MPSSLTRFCFNSCNHMLLVPPTLLPLPPFPRFTWDCRGQCDLEILMLFLNVFCCEDLLDTCVRGISAKFHFPWLQGRTVSAQRSRYQQLGSKNSDETTCWPHCAILRDHLNVTMHDCQYVVRGDYSSLSIFQSLVVISFSFPKAIYHHLKKGWFQHFGAKDDPCPTSKLIQIPFLSHSHLTGEGEAVDEAPYGMGITGTIMENIHFSLMIQSQYWYV